MEDEQAQKDLWLKAKERLKEKVSQTLLGFRHEARRNATLHQVLSLLLLLFSVLTPIASAKASTQGAWSGWSDTVILLSIGVALTEGVRRLYRPDSRWRATAFAVQEIVGARETFRQADILHPQGSPEWRTAFAKFNDDYLTAIRRDMDDFFANSAAPEPKPNPTPPKPAGAT